VCGEGYVPATVPRERDQAPILQEVVLVPLPVWAVAGKRDLTEIRSLDRPARTESQYRLSYPSPQ